MKALSFTKFLGVFIAVFFIIGITFQMIPKTEEMIIGGSAFDAGDSASLQENITDTMVAWIPFVIVMAFVGMGMGYLGMKMGQ